MCKLLLEVQNNKQLTLSRRFIACAFLGFAKFDNQGRAGGIQIQGLDDPNSSFVELDANTLMVQATELKQEINGKSIENPLFNVEPPTNIYSGERGTEDIDKQRSQNRSTNFRLNQFDNPLFGTDLQSLEAAKKLTPDQESLEPGFEKCKGINTSAEHTKGGFSNPVYNTEPLASIKVENSTDLTFGLNNPLYDMEEAEQQQALEAAESSLVELDLEQSSESNLETGTIVHQYKLVHEEGLETNPGLAGIVADQSTQSLQVKMSKEEYAQPVVTTMEQEIEPINVLTRVDHENVLKNMIPALSQEKTSETEQSTETRFSAEENENKSKVVFVFGHKPSWKSHGLVRIAHL